MVSQWGIYGDLELDKRSQRRARKFQIPMTSVIGG